jgi:dihydropteroate synthase
MQMNLMGVINITPNSFSDGGKYITPEGLRAQWRWLIQHCSMLDLGAESTAPMNRPITEAEERRRWEMALDTLKGEASPEFLSMDTYRPSLLPWLTEGLRKIFPSTQLIWNDISGKLDDELVYFLGQNPDCGYILCHNRSPHRYTGAQHGEYEKSSADVVQEITDFMRAGQERLEKLRLSWLGLDPCLGFSKGPQENWEIVKAMPKLMQEIPNAKWVLGLSRKSFLQKSAPYGINPMAHAQHLESLIISGLHRQGINPWFRIHDPTGALASAVYFSNTMWPLPL